MNNQPETRGSRALSLSDGFSFGDLYDREGLLRIDAAFLADLRAAAPALYDRLLAARENPAGLANKQSSELIIELAPHLEDFIGHLFGIGPELRALQARHHELAPLYSVKRRFVQRKALTGQTPKKRSRSTDMWLPPSSRPSCMSR